MFGENILNGVWAYTNNPATVTVAQRGYALGCFQQLIGASGAIRRFLYPSGTPNPRYPPFAYYMYESVDQYESEYFWYRRLSHSDMSWYDDSTYVALFGDVQQDNWYPLAQKMEWVYTDFSNGWPALWVNADNDGMPLDGALPPLGPPSPRPGPRSARPDIRVSPVLTRDAKTGEIVVTITIANRGIRSATNAHLTSVRLGNRSKLPNTTKTHHFLRSNFPETLEVRFPSLAAGTRTMLSIRGEYKGGTFGGSLRVTIS